MPLYSNNSIRPNISSSLYDDSDDHIEVHVPLNTVSEQPGNANETLQGIRSNIPNDVTDTDNSSSEEILHEIDISCDNSHNI